MQSLGHGSRILVTGGAGVIGSVLVRRLLTQGYVVRVLDDLSRSRRERLAGLDVELRVEDIRSERAVKEAVTGCQGIVHLAAPTPRPRTPRDERVGHDVNVTGTLQLCAAAHAAGVGRLVFASSAAVYGPKAPYLLHEDAATSPISAEGAQKLAAEGYLRLYAARGLSTCILRLFSVYGPLQDGRAEDAPVVARFVTQAVRGEPLLIYGDGMQTRDFVHVDDVVEAMVASLEVPNVTGRVFNVAAGTGVPLRHLVAMLSELLGGLPPPRYVERPADEPKDVRASIAAASATLNFRAKTRLREALVAWIQQVGGQRAQPRDQFRRTAPWGVPALGSPPTRITSPQPTMATPPTPATPPARPASPPPLPAGARPRGSGTLETPQVAGRSELFADRPPSWQVPDADSLPELSAVPITDEEWGVIEKIFWLSLLLLLWPWVLYPAVAALLAWLRPLPVRTSGLPSRDGVTVIIAARNEAAHLPAKLASLAHGGLPADRLEVIVVDDGSDDATADVARVAGARVISLPEPRGKAVALTTAREAANHEILVLTDARQPLAEGALALLLAPFADPRVGAVSGELTGGARGAAGVYRRFDDSLRRLEARAASTIGVTGALWAVRKSLFGPLPEGLVLDDVYAPMEVVRARRRVVIAPEARALELHAATSVGAEQRRRVRTLAGNLDLVVRAPWLLVPGLNPLWGRFVSHKLARLLGPLALVATIGTLAVLARRGGHWLVLAALAGGALLLAALGRYAGPPGRLARAFLAAQGLCTLAWLHALSGRTSRLWRPAPNPGASAGVSHGAA